MVQVEQKAIAVTRLDDFGGDDVAADTPHNLRNNVDTEFVAHLRQPLGEVRRWFRQGFPLFDCLRKGGRQGPAPARLSSAVLG